MSDDDLIRRVTDAVWSEVISSREEKWTFRREHVENAVTKTILTLPAAIDPDAAAKIREDALREAASRIVRHEMGTPMHSPPQLLTEAHDAILALIDKKDAAK